MSVSSPAKKSESRTFLGCGILLWAISLVLLYPVDEAYAAIYACVSDGATQFQDRPCPEKKMVKKVKKRVSGLPLGIHSSWFDTPKGAKERAFCDKQGCECGGQVRPYVGSIPQAVADSLFLDGSWHHYEQAFQVWLNTNSKTPEFRHHHQQMLAASCEVMMSQKTLRVFADEVIVSLRKKTLDAENRGFDISGPCDKGNRAACELYDAVKLIRQLKADARALRAPRKILSSSADSPLD